MRLVVSRNSSTNVYSFRLKRLKEDRRAQGQPELSNKRPSQNNEKDKKGDGVVEDVAQ